jgi:iron transport multicopper oxidase
LSNTCIDGLRAPVIIRDNTALANYGNIDGEYTLSLTDVYHVEAPYLINYFLSANNYNGAEPVPDSALINEGQNAKFNITPGKTYMFHIVNMGALAGQFLQFDQHNMTIIEADGVYTQPYEVSQLFVAVAQRYTVLITAMPSDCQNFAIVSQFLTDMFDSSVTPTGQQPTVSLYSIVFLARSLTAKVHGLSGLQFCCSIASAVHTRCPAMGRHSACSLGSTTPMGLCQRELVSIIILQSRLRLILLGSVYLTVDFEQNDWGSNRAAMNGLTYIPQKVSPIAGDLT